VLHLQQRPNGTSGGGNLPSDSEFNARFLVNDVQLQHFILLRSGLVPIIDAAGVPGRTLCEVFIRALYAAL
jgi:hypothetical protein